MDRKMKSSHFEKSTSLPLFVFFPPLQLKLLGGGKFTSPHVIGGSLTPSTIELKSTNIKAFYVEEYRSRYLFDMTTNHTFTY